MPFLSTLFSIFCGKIFLLRFLPPDYAKMFSLYDVGSSIKLTLQGFYRKMLYSVYTLYVYYI